MLTFSPRRLAALLALALLSAAPAEERRVTGALPVPGGGPVGPSAPPRAPAAANLPPGFVQLKLADDSLLILKLLDEKVEIDIKYGKLLIPLADVRSIAVGRHVAEETGKQIEKAVADLASPQFRTREEAGKLLLGLKEKAYPALKRAGGGADAEVVKRAEEVMEKIRGLVPEAKLLIPEYDTVVTADSKFTGRITTPHLKAKSAALGDMTLKFADLALLTTAPPAEELDVANALPDPGNMGQYQNQVGKTLVFKVTGATGATLWGTGTYTLDSGLATAAVHAGALKVGQAGYVKVTIFGPSANFVGSARNGVTSNGFESYPGAYLIHPKGDK